MDSSGSSCAEFIDVQDPLDGCTKGGMANENDADLDQEIENIFCSNQVEQPVVNDENAPQRSPSEISDTSPFRPDFSPHKGISSNEPTDSMDIDEESVNSADIVLQSQKKKRMPEYWARNVLKDQVNKGLAHKTASGNIKMAKSVQPNVCGSKCIHNCSETFPEPQRQRIFDSFYEIADKTRQWDFIARHVQLMECLRNKRGSRRIHSRHYFLPLLTDPLESPRRHRVCASFFMGTLHLSQSTVNTALEKNVRSTAVLSPDNRGSYKRVMSPETAQRAVGVAEHIGLFPKVPSHYSRANTSKMYLEPTLNVATMHRLYLEWAAEKPDFKKLANYRQYLEIFNQQNLSFHSPRKDQCNTCASFTNLSSEDRTPEKVKAYDLHMTNRETGREIKRIEKSRAEEDDTFRIACFDFQKVLNCPAGEASLLYYKRKLSVYNFTIFECVRNVGICNVWDETVAKKGSNEVASCLFLYMLQCIEEGVVEFSFFSDNCPGQNRNRFLFAAFAFFAKNNNVTITHRFLEAGHTQMEADSVHALIERAKEHVKISVPQQWYAVMSNAKKKGTPYRVVEIGPSNIIDSKPFVRTTNWDKNVANKKVEWSAIKEVRIERTRPNVLLYKTQYLDADYQELVIYSSRPPVGRKPKKCFECPASLPLAYSTTLPISAAKKRDLLSLCHTNIIPSAYHDFYKDLPAIDDFDDVDDDDVWLDEFFVDS